MGLVVLSIVHKRLEALSSPPPPLPFLNSGNPRQVSAAHSPSPSSRGQPSRPPVQPKRSCSECHVTLPRPGTMGAGRQRRKGACTADPLLQRTGCGYCQGSGTCERGRPDHCFFCCCCCSRHRAPGVDPAVIGKSFGPNTTGPEALGSETVQVGSKGGGGCCGQAGGSHTR